MKNINRATLLGFLGHDPLVKEVGNTTMAQLRLATNETWKDKAGEKHERVEWHNIEVWIPAMVDVIQRNLHKGSKVYVEGQLQTRKWEDREGKERTTTSICVRPFSGCLVMLDGSREQPAVSAPPAKSSRSAYVADDDIPF